MVGSERWDAKIRLLLSSSGWQSMMHVCVSVVVLSTREEGLLIKMYSWVAVGGLEDVDSENLVVLVVMIAASERVGVVVSSLMSVLTSVEGVGVLCRGRGKGALECDSELKVPFVGQ